MTSDLSDHAALLERTEAALRSFEATVAKRRALVEEQYAVMQEWETAITTMRHYLALAYDGLTCASERP